MAKEGKELSIDQHWKYSIVLFICSLILGIWLYYHWGEVYYQDIFTILKKSLKALTESKEQLRREAAPLGREWDEIITAFNQVGTYIENFEKQNSSTKQSIEQQNEAFMVQQSELHERIKKADYACRILRERNRLMAGTIWEAAILYDNEGNIIDTNSPARNLFKIHRDQPWEGEWADRLRDFALKCLDMDGIQAHEKEFSYIEANSTIPGFLKIKGTKIPSIPPESDRVIIFCTYVPPNNWEHFLKNQISTFSESCLAPLVEKIKQNIPAPPEEDETYDFSLEAMTMILENFILDINLFIELQKEDISKRLSKQSVLGFVEAVRNDLSELGIVDEDDWEIDENVVDMSLTINSRATQIFCDTLVRAIHVYVAPYGLKAGFYKNEKDCYLKFYLQGDEAARQQSLHAITTLGMNNNLKGEPASELLIKQAIIRFINNIEGLPSVDTEYKDEILTLIFHFPTSIKKVMEEPVKPKSEINDLVKDFFHRNQA